MLNITFTICTFIDTKRSDDAYATELVKHNNEFKQDERLRFYVYAIHVLKMEIHIYHNIHLMWPGAYSWDDVKYEIP